MWHVESAGSGRAKCQECGSKVNKGSIRVQITAGTWNHLPCAVKTFSKENESVDLSKFYGFSALEPEAQSEICFELLNAGLITSSDMPVPDGQGKKKRKTKAKRKRDKGDDDGTPTTTKTDKGKKNKRARASTDNGSADPSAQYANLKVKDLKAELEKRGLSTAGAKKLLAERLGRDDADALIDGDQPSAILIDDDSEDDDDGTVAYKDMKAADLKALLLSRGLATSGGKAALVQRLEDDDAGVQVVKPSKKKKASKQADAPKTKKAKAAAPAASGAMSTEAKLQEQYENMSAAALKDLLRKNDQHLSGSKTELVDRVVDRKMYGAVPRCPSCGGGKLKLSYHSKNHGGQGSYHCPGYYDDDEFIYCHYRSSYETRIPWQD